jgi:hypothetical protein
MKKVEKLGTVFRQFMCTNPEGDMGVESIKIRLGYYYSRKNLLKLCY